MASTLSACTSVRATRPCCPRLGHPNYVAAQREVRARAVASVEAFSTAGEAEFSAAKPSSSYLTTSEKYAIIDVGGVQHLVEEGRWYTCNRLKAAPGDVVSFGRVLALKADGQFHVGQPYVDGVTVEAEIVEEMKGPKVTIYKMQPKKHTRKTVGHRQPLSKCAPPYCGGHDSCAVSVASYYRHVWNIICLWLEDQKQGCDERSMHSKKLLLWACPC